MRLTCAGETWEEEEAGEGEGEQREGDGAGDGEDVSGCAFFSAPLLSRRTSKLTLGVSMGYIKPR